MGAAAVTPPGAAEETQTTEDESVPVPTSAPPKPADEEDIKNLHSSALKSKASVLSLRAAHAAVLAETVVADAKEIRRRTEMAAHNNEDAVARIKSLVTQTRVYKEATWKARISVNTTFTKEILSLARPRMLPQKINLLVNV